MECKNILENDLHEKYILGRIGESDRAEYESHIHHCESCRAELENQKRIIAALKEIGREEMKREIRRRVEIREAVRADRRWTKLSKIAAVLLLFIMTPTIIYYVRKDKPRLMTTSAPRMRVEAPVADYRGSPEQVTGQQSDILEGTPPADRGEPSRKPKIAGKTESTSVTGEERLYQPAQPQRLGRSVLPEEKRASVMEDERAAHVIAEAEVTEVPENAMGRQERNTRETAVVDTYVFDAGSSAAEGRSPAASYRKTYHIGQESGTDATQVWRFVSKGSVINVHLKEVYEENLSGVIAEDAAKVLPQFFPVEIVRRDSLNMEMRWFVGPAFSGILPTEIGIDVLSDQTMHIVVEDTVIYRVDLKSSKTRAVLEKKDE